MCVCVLSIEMHFLGRKERKEGREKEREIAQVKKGEGVDG